MTDEATKVFAPDPPPSNMDVETAEWIMRQLRRVSGSTQIIETTQKDQDGISGTIRQDLDAHIQDQTNPHTTRHEQLSDVAFPTILTNPHGMMRWPNDGGLWVPGDYLKNDVVRDGEYTMIANKDTNERPAPQPAGDPFFVYQGTSPEDSVTARELAVAQRYTFPADAFFTKYRIYEVPGQDYRVFLIRDPDGTPIVSDLISFSATGTGWREFNLPTQIIPAGTVFELWAAIVEPDPTPTTWTGNWNYTTPPQDGTPGTGEALHANANLGVLRIHKTDNDAGNRGPELLSMSPGEIIELQGLRWTIQGAPIDDGTYVSFAIAPAQQAPADGVFLFTFETVTATPITTVIDPNYFQGNANVDGRYTLDGSSYTVTEDAYGIDIELQEAAISEDWDLVARSA